MNFLYAAQPTGTDIISLADMKEFLRVDHSDEDTTITAIIDSAVQSVQDYTGRHFKSTTWNLYIDSFHYVNFPYQINNVTEVRYRAAGTGFWTVLSENKYFYDSARQPGRLQFINTPNLLENKFNIVEINGTVSATSIEAPLTHAIKMLAAHFYENRRAVIVTNSSEIPLGIKALINPYRIISLK